MSTATLNNLIEYLYGTLSPDNMRWVAKHLIERAEQVEEPPGKRDMAPLTRSSLTALRPTAVSKNITSCTAKK